jgi:mutator protein MutT
VKKESKAGGREARARPSRAQRSTRGPGSPVEVAAGLIFRRGKLLITQRHASAHLGGLWEFPGGKRERNETFEQCLERELREELGVEVSVGGVLESITHEYPGKTVHLKFFPCRLRAGEPQPLGCPALKWVGKSELKAYPFPAADARLLGMLCASAGLWVEA